jgi:hypothetical protein
MKIKIMNEYTKKKDGTFTNQETIDNQIDDWNKIVKHAEAGLIYSAGGGRGRDIAPPTTAT